MAERIHPDMTDTLSLAEAARRIGMNDETLRLAMKRGELAGCWMEFMGRGRPRRIRVTLEALEAFAQARGLPEEAWEVAEHLADVEVSLGMAAKLTGRSYQAMANAAERGWLKGRVSLESGGRHRHHVTLSELAKFLQRRGHGFKWRRPRRFDPEVLARIEADLAARTQAA